MALRKINIYVIRFSVYPEISSIERYNIVSPLFSIHLILVRRISVRHATQYPILVLVSLSFPSRDIQLKFYLLEVISFILIIWTNSISWIFQFSYTYYLILLFLYVIQTGDSSRTSYRINKIILYLMALACTMRFRQGLQWPLTLTIFTSLYPSILS